MSAGEKREEVMLRSKGNTLPLLIGVVFIAVCIWFIFGPAQDAYNDVKSCQWDRSEITIVTSEECKP